MKYNFYLKTSDGFRGEVIRDVTSFEVTFRMNEVSKWTMSGAGLKPCPFSEGSEIIVYRGSEPFFSGFANEIKDSYDTAARIYDWSVSGEDDFGRLAHRVIYPDASAEEPAPGEEADYTGFLSDVLLTIVRENAAAGYCRSERIIPRLDVSTIPGLGEEQTLTAHFDTLLPFVLDKLKDKELGIRGVWNGTTGRWDLQIFQPRDVSETVIFSVEAGSLAGWERTKKAPAANWIYCKGCEVSDDSGEPTGEIMTVIVSDTDSIATWGRIEKYLDQSSITQIIEKDEEGREISRESWDSVRERLRQAALDALVENSAQNGYKLTIAEIDRMAYKTHWDLGDTVAVRVADTEFRAAIEEIKVQMEDGVETVTPSVGEMQKGELESVFTELGSLRKQIEVLQKK